MDRGAWGAIVHRVCKSQTLLKQLSMNTHTKMLTIIWVFSNCSIFWLVQYLTLMWWLLTNYDGCWSLVVAITSFFFFFIEWKLLCILQCFTIIKSFTYMILYNPTITFFWRFLKIRQQWSLPQWLTFSFINDFLVACTAVSSPTVEHLSTLGSVLSNPIVVLLSLFDILKHLLLFQQFS